MVSHTAWREPIFNNVYNVSRDPGSFSHTKLGPVPGFSGGVRVFYYTGPPKQGSQQGQNRGGYKGNNLGPGQGQGNDGYYHENNFWDSTRGSGRRGGRGGGHRPWTNVTSQRYVVVVFFFVYTRV